MPADDIVTTSKCACLRATSRRAGGGEGGGLAIEIQQKIAPIENEGSVDEATYEFDERILHVICAETERAQRAKKALVD